MKKSRQTAYLQRKKCYLKLDIVFLLKHKKLIYCINVKYSHSVGVNFNKCDLVNWICKICATDLTILWNQKFRILLFQIWSTKNCFLYEVSALTIYITLLALLYSYFPFSLPLASHQPHFTLPFATFMKLLLLICVLLANTIHCCFESKS